MPMATMIMPVPISLPSMTSPRHTKYTIPGARYALTPSRSYRLRAAIMAEGSQMHSAHFMTSAGCSVNTPGMPIHPVLPYGVMPRGVSVSACSTIEKPRPAMPSRR